MGLLPSQVRQAVTTRILALQPTDGYTAGRTGYAHAAGDAWRAAEEPLFPEWEPTTRAHLGFFVDDRELIDTARSRSTVEDEPIVDAPLVVRFNYRIRGIGKRIADWDAAGAAGVHVLRHLLAEGWALLPFSIYRDTRPLTRIPVQGDEFALVEVRVRALFPLSLGEQS